MITELRIRIESLCKELFRKKREKLSPQERNRLMILFSAFPFFLRLYGSRHKSILGFVNIHSCINPSGILYFIASKHGIMKFSFFLVKEKIKIYSETSHDLVFLSSQL